MKKNIAIIILSFVLLASLGHSLVLRIELDRQRDLMQQLMKQVELAEELEKKQRAIAEEMLQRAINEAQAAHIMQDSARH